jgi:hypothetical protein
MVKLGREDTSAGAVDDGASLQAANDTAAIAVIKVFRLHMSRRTRWETMPALVLRDWGTTNFTGLLLWLA